MILKNNSETYKKLFDSNLRETKMLFLQKPLRSDYLSEMV